LRDAGFIDGRAHVELALDLRYRGQAYELTIPLDRSARHGDAAELARAEERFHRTHEAVYGHVINGDVEVVTVRGRAIGAVADSVDELALSSPAGAHIVSTREITGSRGGETYRSLRRLHLEPGRDAAGPLVFDEEDTTVVVPPGWVARRGAYETILLTREREAR
jgi:N-methylhydantoinase A